MSCKKDKKKIKNEERIEEIKKMSEEELKNCCGGQNKISKSILETSQAMYIGTSDDLVE
jgi:hypothetical protein